MPEEINRILTDQVADYLFVSEDSGLAHLKTEGIPDAKVFHVGNIMIDTLARSLEASRGRPVLEELGLEPGAYAVITLHRPSNVDDRRTLTDLLEVLVEESERTPMVFPCHPRTRKELDRFGVVGATDIKGLRLVEPLGYLDFLRLQSRARLVITDSGGIQEETTYLRVPCITVRDTTERPATVEIGSNILTGPNPERLKEAMDGVMEGRLGHGEVPEYWDGQTAQRIVSVLRERL
jgi:UDP-N-acetylglucosamine 2-epimerase (non-hydrolysing)